MTRPRLVWIHGVNNDYWKYSGSPSVVTLTYDPTSPRTAAPQGTWIEPYDGQIVGDDVHFSTLVYPTSNGDPGIGRVDFKAWWDTLGPGEWQGACSVVTYNANGDVYSCDWPTIDVPDGDVHVSFEVYNESDDSNPALISDRTIKKASAAASWIWDAPQWFFSAMPYTDFHLSGQGELVLIVDGDYSRHIVHTVEECGNNGSAQLSLGPHFYQTGHYAAFPAPNVDIEQSLVHIACGAGRQATSTPESTPWGFVVSGHVFIDANGNGAQDEGEIGYEGAAVRIAGRTATTDADGYYSVSGLPSGALGMDLVVPTGYTVYKNWDTVFLSPDHPAALADWPLVLGQGGTPTPTYTPVTPNSTNTPVTPPPGTYIISGRAYIDTNGNGYQDPGEPGYAGASVNIILRGMFCVVAPCGWTGLTDANGNYSFPAPSTGTYEVSLGVPDGYTTSRQNPSSISVPPNITVNWPLVPVPAPGPTNQPTNTPTDNMPATIISVQPPSPSSVGTKVCVRATWSYACYGGMRMRFGNQPWQPGILVPGTPDYNGQYDACFETGNLPSGSFTIRVEALSAPPDYPSPYVFGSAETNYQLLPKSTPTPQPSTSTPQPSTPSPTPSAKLCLSSSTGLNFSTASGGSLIGILTIANCGGGTLTWTASVSQPWIILTATSGTANSNVTVAGKPGSMAQGTYKGSITINSNGGTQSMPVTLVIK